MIGRLKEAVDLLKSPENRSECDSVNDAIGILIDFVTLAIKSEWKWPIATHHYRCDSNDCGKCNCKQFLTEKTILDASEKVADLQMRFAEFERLTKARCEVIENFIGLMSSECKHEFQANTDGHPYCTKCGKYAYSNAYKPTIRGTYADKKDTYADKKDTYADKKDTYADDSIKLPVPIVKPSEVLTALLCCPVGNVVVGSIEEKRMLREAIQKIKDAGL